jgi:putative acetyltransferase
MTMADVVIRDESAADADAIRVVHARAFPTDLEARIVDALRDAGAVVVSQVAVVSGNIVGHVLLSRASIEGNDPGISVLGLAPLSVVPEYQRRGIGSALMQSALEQARARSVAVVVLVGEPDYYARFGFVPAKRFGLRCKWPATDEAFMARELIGGTLTRASGRVAYHEAFDAVE